MTRFLRRDPLEGAPQIDVLGVERLPACDESAVRLAHAPLGRVLGCDGCHGATPRLPRARPLDRFCPARAIPAPRARERRHRPHVPALVARSPRRARDERRRRPKPRELALHSLERNHGGVLLERHAREVRAERRSPPRSTRRAETRRSPPSPRGARSAQNRHRPPFPRRERIVLTPGVLLEPAGQLRNQPAAAVRQGLENLAAGILKTVGEPAQVNVGADVRRGVGVWPGVELVRMGKATAGRGLPERPRVQPERPRVQPRRRARVGPRARVRARVMRGRLGVTRLGGVARPGRAGIVDGDRLTTRTGSTGSTMCTRSRSWGSRRPAKRPGKRAPGAVVRGGCSLGVNPTKVMSDRH